MTIFERVEHFLKSDVFLAFAGMALLLGLVFWVLTRIRPASSEQNDATKQADAAGAPGTRFSRTQKALGIEGLPAPVFALAALVWTIILVSLLAGLGMLIWTVILHAVPEPAPAPFADATATPPAPVADATAAPPTPAKTSVWEYRFLLAQLAAITTVLGAVVAFPVTLSRLRLASEDRDTRAAALYNDKINAALTDLHAQRQVTEWKRKEGHVAVWQDDIVRRNGAIDRLESLAHENSAEAPRIARMLATYLRELSEVFAPKDRPPVATLAELRDWAGGLTRARSDMENAAQTLGRLRNVAGMTPETLIIDLHGANLQGTILSGARIEGANLTGARMEGADLRWARMEGADLSGARMEGANLGRARIEGANLTGARMEGANLFWARMEGADLRWARMEGADLRWARMEGADLFGARMEGANLGRARMEGANLFWARMEGANLTGARFDQSTDFSAANTTRAALKSVDLTNIRLSETQVKSMFGDGSVTLPDDRRPAHWPSKDLGVSEFYDEWERYKSDPDAYIPPQDR